MFFEAVLSLERFLIPPTQTQQAEFKSAFLSYTVHMFYHNQSSFPVAGFLLCKLHGKQLPSHPY